MISKIRNSAKRKVIAQARANFKQVPPRYYFAYGSNLCIDGMIKRCPDARKIKALQLRGCKLIFRGVADIEITNDENDWVEGGLWRITTYDESRLDSYEGVSIRKPEDGLYRKLTFPIGNTKDDVVWDCLIYKMNRTGIMPPSEHYFNIIQQGYADFGLNLDKLNEALESSWDDKNRTPQLNARYDRNGRPPLARKPKVIAPEPEPVGVMGSPAFDQQQDPATAEEVTKHFVPPDQWVEGNVKTLVAPDRSAPTAPPSCPDQSGTEGN